MTGPTNHSAELYALLIGVDYYFPNRLPDGGYYPSLGGCVRDVRYVETFLRDRMGVDDDHLITLTISNFSGPYPPEPPEQWPTYENMVTVFKQVTAMAAQGDQVYIHYAGHGGRAVTAFPELKGKEGLDETLVPTGIGNPEANYLRDVELHYLLQAMVDKGLVVTVVLDSCHSGGATRGLGRVAVRGIATVDTTPRPVSNMVALPAALQAAWQGVSGPTRALKSASGWLMEPQGYTLLAACRANESAHEYPFESDENNGALTYWLLDTLRAVGSGPTYKQIYDRILAKVHGQFEGQTPMLQGEGDRVIFGSAKLSPVYAVAVLAVDDTGRVRLNAGQAHGLVAGARFALYPSTATDLSDPRQAPAVVEVCQVNAVDCWAQRVEQQGRNQVPLEAGAQAVLLEATDVRLQRAVGVTLDSPTLRAQLEQAIAAEGRGFVAAAQGAAPIDFQVALSADQSLFEIWDAAGAAIPNLRPPVRADDPDGSKCIVQRLVHLAKYRNVQALSAPGNASAQSLTVEVTGTSDASERVTPFRPGDKVTVHITNTQAPNPADPNDPTRILNITVLDLASDWSIQQIYPAHAGAFEPLQPGATLPLEFDAYLPDGYTESRDIVKVFATQATTQFHWLELPALDQPHNRSQTLRGLLTDPLEQMLAKITADKTSTRAIRLSGASSDVPWSVTQVEVQVKV